MKTSFRPIAIITVSLFGFFLIISFYADRSSLVHSSNEMHTISKETDYLVSLEESSKWSNVMFVDLRDNNKFEIDSGDTKAVNIPLSAILNEEYESFFESDNPKVLLSHDPVKSHEAWMLLTQMGYEKLFVSY